jgi:hypothetical protein
MIQHSRLARADRLRASLYRRVESDEPALFQRHGLRGESPPRTSERLPQPRPALRQRHGSAGVLGQRLARQTHR